MRKLVITIAVALAVMAGATVHSNHPTTTERGHTVVLDRHGCVVKYDIDSSFVHLLFSADSAFEGGAFALDVLDERGLKGNFFFTGNFLERPENETIIRRCIDGEHYVGMHSNRHLQLAEWDGARTTRISPDSMLADLDSNLLTLNHFGLLSAPVYVLPPFEWCNTEHARAYRSAGYTPINITPGIETYRDYTTPDMKEYRDSQFMLDQLWEYEEENGLNGAMIILHLGTEPARTDKLYYHLPEILDSLQARGYSVRRL